MAKKKTREEILAKKQNRRAGIVTPAGEVKTKRDIELNTHLKGIEGIKATLNACSRPYDQLRLTKCSTKVTDGMLSVFEEIKKECLALVEKAIEISRMKDETEASFESAELILAIQLAMTMATNLLTDITVELSDHHTLDEETTKNLEKLKQDSSELNDIVKGN